jgi:Fur family peroxide stress response transcriptional regulator
MKLLKNTLVASKIKPTYQRLAILRYIYDNRVHPTVDMIYDDLLEKIPTISKTTIYNTLEMFVKKGLVAPIVITGTEMRYDPAGGYHHHFLCERCSRIIDMEMKCSLGGKASVNGHLVQEIHCYIKGVCKDCLSSAKQGKK